VTENDIIKACIKLLSLFYDGYRSPNRIERATHVTIISFFKQKLLCHHILDSKLEATVKHTKE